MRLLLTLLPLLPLALTHPLILHIPSTLPPLPPSTHATLTTKNHTLRALLTRANTFVFRSSDLISPFTYNNNNKDGKAEPISYLLDIACRDYDFVSYGLDVAPDGKMEVYRVMRGGIEVGGREVVGEGGVEVRVLRGREFYEARAGFSPLDLLKNPMILIAVVGLAFVIGMPYLMDNMDPEMKKEFEEQQKKSILSGGASAANPLQNFDVAAWMAGKTTGSASAEKSADEGSGGGGGGGGGSGSGSGGRVRRRG